MYNLTLRGIAGPETDLAKARVYVQGGPAIEVAASPGQPFTAAAQYPVSGPVDISYAYVDTAGNEGARHTQTVIIPDVTAPAAPVGDLELVSVVWA